MARLTFSSGAGAVAIVVNDREWYSTGYRRKRFWIAFIIASDNVTSNRHDQKLGRVQVIEPGRQVYWASQSYR